MLLTYFLNAFEIVYYYYYYYYYWGQVSVVDISILAARFWDRILVGAKYSPPVQTCPVK